MKPSQLIPFGQVDAAYDKLHDEHEEVKRNLEFAFKRTMVLVRMLGLEDAVVESPAVTGTILGMVRQKVEQLKKFEMEQI